jgi:hypothetical protein
MSAQLDKDHIDQVEYDIRPPMKQAITIPVSNGAIIYVATSPFGLKQPLSDEALQILASGLLSMMNWLEAQRMVAGAEMYRDYYATDLEPDELTEFDAIVTKLEAVRDALPEPPAETMREWHERVKRETS